jgi:hypothetical protein
MNSQSKSYTIRYFFRFLGDINSHFGIANAGYLDKTNANWFFDRSIFPGQQ